MLNSLIKRQIFDEKQNGQTQRATANRFGKTDRQTDIASNDCVAGGRERGIAASLAHVTNENPTGSKSRAISAGK